MILEKWVDRFEIQTGFPWGILKIEIIGNRIFKSACYNVSFSFNSGGLTETLEAPWSTPATLIFFLKTFSTACKFRMHQLKSSYLMEGLYMKDARTRYSCDIFPFFLFQNLTFLHINISSHHYEYPSPILLKVSNKLNYSLLLPVCQKTTSHRPYTERSCPHNNTFPEI